MKVQHPEFPDVTYEFATVKEGDPWVKAGWVRVDEPEPKSTAKSAAKK